MRVAHADVRLEGEGAVVELADERGHIGLGEASPLVGRSRDSLETSVEALRIATRSLGAIDADAPARIAVSRALSPFSVALDAAPSARFALETALFDLLGHAQGRSVAQLLGGPRSYDVVALNGLCRIARGAPPAELATAGARLVAEGYTALKVKLPLEQDEATFDAARSALVALRERLPDVELRVDVNGAWAPDVALRRLEALAPLALAYVEQPVAPEHVDLLRSARVPWAADESLEVPGAAEKIVAEARCAAVVLKPTCLGGLVRAHAIAELAIGRGLAVVVTHAFEGPIALAAACELALSLSCPPRASGLAPHERLVRHPRRAVRQLATPGFARAVAAAGLGLDHA